MLQIPLAVVQDASTDETDRHTKLTKAAKEHEVCEESPELPFLVDESGIEVDAEGRDNLQTEGSSKFSQTALRVAFKVIVDKQCFA